MTKNRIKYILIMLIVALALVFGQQFVVSPTDVLFYTPGVYYGYASGYEEHFWVEVAVTKKSIVSVQVLSNNDTLEYVEKAESMTEKMVELNTPYVDVVAGASLSSKAIFEATCSCLDQALGRVDPILYKPVHIPDPLEYKYVPGVYTAAASSKDGEVLNVEVTFSESEISFITIVNDQLTENTQLAQKDVIDHILWYQNYDVDVVTGATYSSNAIKEAVKNCVEQARVKDE